ncbi:flavodoxin family protein [Anaeromicropila herbilytica]|uniref:Flavodoxin family protein n=1 Tax=Anaeromicropila herbilytica TaxID=2785025 RepID=A0A7R7ELX2_9FIRM|nr:flavodoxin family protein [Anaeromicropila herbilytica]BCN31239.1 hypothetical protein bsdtb5_25340 [Anaeromicropila herbilytica]
MKLLIHDLKSDVFQSAFPSLPEDTKITSNESTIHHCIGCFGCWVKTPSKCSIRDKYGNMGEYLSKCNELIIVSNCRYGGFSPFVKSVLDRSISYVHPYFRFINGEMHHKRRYDNKINLHVHFYGEITEDEKNTANKLVKANSINLDLDSYDVSFYKVTKEMEGIILCK